MWFFRKKKFEFIFSCDGLYSNKCTSSLVVLNLDNRDFFLGLTILFGAYLKSLDFAYYANTEIFKTDSV